MCVVLDDAYARCVSRQSLHRTDRRLAVMWMLLCRMTWYSHYMRGRASNGGDTKQECMVCSSSKQFYTCGVYLVVMPVWKYRQMTSTQRHLLYITFTPSLLRSDSRDVSEHRKCTHE